MMKVLCTLDTQSIHSTFKHKACLQSSLSLCEKMKGMFLCNFSSVVLTIREWYRVVILQSWLDLDALYVIPCKNCQASG